ncbi:hypothetical protein [Salmonella phage NINP13076]|uniref:Uncharacterized protein n=1 Tax=Salmonella phage vB_SEnST11_KE22 TaxID=3161173 RepID=A0AAU8GFS0_9CAUD|nr:hypothetical protein [Salmonella phage NINP13076]
MDPIISIPHSHSGQDVTHSQSRRFLCLGVIASRTVI